MAIVKTAVDGMPKLNGAIPLPIVVRRTNWAAGPPTKAAVGHEASSSFGIAACSRVIGSPLGGNLQVNAVPLSERQNLGCLHAAV